MDDMVKAIAYCAAAFAVGIGTLGPAIAQGLIGSRACENIGKYPENLNAIRTMAFAALAMVETLVLFAVLIALVIIVSVR
jgi:F-type H+-transporting ATPase subunit c